jgi:RNA polymerase sigma factor (sigma-70 family)
MTDDANLIQEYAKSGSDTAFTELVSRHLPLVYSAALRQVGGDQQLAKDVTQTVFIDLARKAARLSRREVLEGWLYTSTRFAAAKAVRSERRRQVREQIAVAMQDQNTPTHPAADWEQIAPVLDESMQKLSPAERTAILLRFFKNQQFSAVGEALGVSADAARTRTTRALEKLRTVLSRRGVSLSAAGLATLLAGSAVQSAPAALIATIATSSLAAAPAAAGGTLFALIGQSLAGAKAKLAAIGTVGLALVSCLVLQHHANVALAAENASLRELTGPLAELEQLRHENQAMANLRVDAAELERLRASQPALPRLRGEYGALQRQLAQLRTATGQAAAPTNASGVWRVGEEPTREQWLDAGDASPAAAIESFWWAVANSNATKLARCFTAGSNQMPPSSAYIEYELRRMGRLTGRAERIRLVSVSQPQNEQANVKIALVGVQGDAVFDWLQREFTLCNLDDHWKILPDYAGAASTALAILNGDRPEKAKQVWQALPPDVAADARSKLDPSVVSRFPWLQSSSELSQ